MKSSEMHLLSLGTSTHPRLESLSTRCDRQDAQWSDTTTAGHCHELLKLRDASLVMIEEARQSAGIKTSFEVEIDLIVTEYQSQVSTILQAHGTLLYGHTCLPLQHIADTSIERFFATLPESELTELFNVARLNLLRQGCAAEADPKAVLVSRTLDSGVSMRLCRSSRHRCPRCRTMRREAESERLCGRCQAVVDTLSI